MSNEPCGLRLTENDIRTHLEILTIAEIALGEEIECLEEQPKDIGICLSRLAGIRRIIDAAKRDLKCTHDYLTDEMGKKGMKIRFA